MRQLINSEMIDHTDNETVLNKIKNNFPNWERMSGKQKADLLRGCLGYRKHYEYLMDWYVKDKRLDESNRMLKIMRAEMNAKSRKNKKDKLRSLKVLEGKIAMSCDTELLRQSIADKRV